jgi:hypothetical protein
MIKSLTLASVVAAATLMSGCALQPTHALLYSSTNAPMGLTNVDADTTKEGESETCTNILGLIATGDCSIANAKKNGNIKSVSTVDWKGTNVLGIWATGNTVVTGN